MKLIRESVVIQILTFCLCVTANTLSKAEFPHSRDWCHRLCKGKEAMFLATFLTATSLRTIDESIHQHIFGENSRENRDDEWLHVNDCTHCFFCILFPFWQYERNYRMQMSHFRQVCRFYGHVPSMRFGVWFP